MLIYPIQHKVSDLFASKDTSSLFLKPDGTSIRFYVARKSIDKISADELERRILVRSPFDMTQYFSTAETLIRCISGVRG